MNKAFTKESDYDEAADAVVQPVDPLPSGVPNYVTPSGAARVREELRRLIEERPALEVRAGTGRESEGARDNETKAKARKQLAELKARVRFLEEHVGRFEIVDPSRQQDADTVRFGARVTVLDGAGDERTYLICGVDEAAPELGAVSWISPIAKALIGREIGDEVTLRLPRGEQVLEIVEIEYG